HQRECDDKSKIILFHREQLSPGSLWTNVAKIVRIHKIVHVADNPIFQLVMQAMALLCELTYIQIEEETRGRSRPRRTRRHSQNTFKKSPNLAVIEKNT